jgi:hypothetical protein
MQLSFLNQLKKEHKGTRKEQNKRYREKHHDIINLKKQLAYHKKRYELKLKSTQQVNVS